jgi:uncharacterized MAPEG superfamily protein
MTLSTISMIVACVLPVVCAGIAKWGFKGYDNRTPRDWLASQQGYRKRANAAQQNGWETLPIFLVGVVLARQNGVAPGTIDLIAVVYVVSRIAYVGLYLADVAMMRTLVWTIGLGLALALYVIG